MTLLTPFATAAVFLFKVVPGLIHARFKVRVLGLYRRLERIEKTSHQADNETLLDELEALDRESAGLKVRGPSKKSFSNFGKACTMCATVSRRRRKDPNN